MNRSRYTPPGSQSGGGIYRHGDSNPGTNPARQRGFSVCVSDPTGHVTNGFVSVEELGQGELYRFVLDDGSDWMVDGRELREALA